MNVQDTKPRVMKESKNKIRVDFERTSAWTRFRLKYLSLRFLGTVIFRLFRLVLLLGISYVIIYPFITKIASSFMDKSDFVDATVRLIPKSPTLNTYKQIIRENSYFEALFNTFVLSLICAIIQMFICCVVGYGFGKYKFKGSKILFGCVMLSMVVPHQMLKLSLYSEFKYFDIYGLIELITGKTIDLTNSFWPLALLSLTGLAFKNGLYIYMMRQFFRGVPDELEESAYIDGSGVFRTFIQIILPLSIPMMVTVFLFAFSWQWTDNFYSKLFFTSSRNGILLLPKFVGVPRTLEDPSFPATELYYAAIRNTCGLLIIAPLLIVYLFCQRFLIQGIERSGITG